ncbi:HotDog domain-containing protein [Biscogniauxia marginata]|nr:HotDog domain-containing protein [Biscogniauxia marginata]
MAYRDIIARRLLASSLQRESLRPRGHHLTVLSLYSRSFHGTSVHRTDGVFRGLADDRLSTPWIEAWKLQQQQGNNAASGEAVPRERDLTSKKMSDSYHRVVLPLGRDPWLSDTYINSSGHIRLGTIFMDLDALSGIVVYKHTGPGVTVVTAALDRITIAHPLTEICDLEYSGQVTYASGRSSVEITCKVARAREEGEPSKPEDVLLTCTFTMVALDPVTKKPVNIPRLVCSTPEEERIFKTGEAKALAKKKLLKTSLLEAEPNDPESALIHKIWLRQLAYHNPNRSLRQPSNVIAMAKTQLSTASIMQPQYRNRHQTMIFGGFHLKQTFELAFCCAASFAHARPTFISADPCTFRNPVPVGSVLYLTATVVYTDPPVLELDDDDGDDGDDGDGDGSSSSSSEPPRQQPDPASPPATRLHVRVDSKVRDVEHGNARPTGQFNYTFLVPRDVRVLPHTYQEYMMYIDARRRVRLGDDQDRREHASSGSGSQQQQQQFKYDENANLTE